MTEQKPAAGSGGEAEAVASAHFSPPKEWEGEGGGLKRYDK